MFVQLQSGTILETDNPTLWPEAKRVPAKKAKQQLRQESLEFLHTLIQPGDTVYTILRHVSGSGMSRRIDVVVIKDGQPITITGHVGRLLDYRQSDKGGLIVGGCGMDMGFSVVHNLSYAMFRDGFTCTGERCPSNDHSNGDRNRKPHKHTEGGYALRHAWI